MFYRTKLNHEKFGIPIPQEYTIVEPMSFRDWVVLLRNSRCVMTDSGTAQEETSYYDVPCVTMRFATERPETEEYGSNVVAGTRVAELLDATTLALQKTQADPSLWKARNTAELIVDGLVHHPYGRRDPNHWKLRCMNRYARQRLLRGEHDPR